LETDATRMCALLVDLPSFGWTISRWATQIVAWHRSHVSNGPTEAVIIWPSGSSASRSGS
jgi:transposase